MIQFFLQDLFIWHNFVSSKLVYTIQLYFFKVWLQDTILFLLDSFILHNFVSPKLVYMAPFCSLWHNFCFIKIILYMQVSFTNLFSLFFFLFFSSPNWNVSLSVRLTYFTQFVYWIHISIRKLNFSTACQVLQNCVFLKVMFQSENSIHALFVSY